MPTPNSELQLRWSRCRSSACTTVPSATASSGAPKAGKALLRRTTGHSHAKAGRGRAGSSRVMSLAYAWPSWWV
ncbi:hypothetical protein [Streptomyces sp. B6(2022)]|uniref:hypothetical protein n=1 Tax=Streptomyces sp. B6(2022) TaxID=3404749 RepID=UPI003AF168A0